MRLDEAITFQLVESYKDAEEIIPELYAMIPFADSETMRTIGLGDVRQFKGHADAGRLDSPDISPWIGRANRIIRSGDEAEARQFFSDFRSLLSDAEDKIPEFTVVAQSSDIRVTNIENFAAVRKLCGRMNICIRTSKEDFDNYAEHGVLLLFEMRGRKFVYEYDERTDDGSFWDERNNEYSVGEFIDLAGMRELPNIITNERDILDALDVIDDEIY